MKEQFDGICLNDDDMRTCVFGLRFQCVALSNDSQAYVIGNN